MDPFINNKIEIYQYISDKYNFFSQSFVEECVEEFFNTHETYDRQSILNYALEKLQTINLRNFAENSSLKQININDLNRQILNGNHFIQIETAINIRKSCNEQIKELKENSKQNVIGQRMYLFTISDGLKDIIAIEDEQIPYFNSNLFTPGLKAILKGPILYINKRLLLKSKNIMIMGGQIVDYLEKNGLLNILNHTLFEKKMSGNVNTEQNTRICERNNFTKETVDDFNLLPNHEHNVSKIDLNKKDNNYDDELELISVLDNFKDISELNQLEFNSDELKQNNKPDLESNTESYNICSPKNPSKHNYNIQNPLDDDENLFSCIDTNLIYDEMSNPCKIKSNKICKQNQIINSNNISLQLSQLSPLKKTSENDEEKNNDGLYMIKVYSVKILKKLSIKDNKWTLTMILTNGDLCLPFLFSNDVLEKIIEIKACEFKNIVKLSDSVILSQQKIKELKEKMQKYLKEFKAIVLVEFKENYEHPIILDIIHELDN